jgi:hypothetical protein
MVQVRQPRNGGFFFGSGLSYLVGAFISDQALARPAAELRSAVQAEAG